MTILKSSSTRENGIFLFLSILVWIYIWIRTFTVPATIDETATFFMYIQSGRIFPPSAAWDANNHLLNSLLSRWIYLLSGPSVVGLRLANVLFFPVYAFFILKISRQLNYTISRWAFILAMLATHFIIEFFGYGRGYGMSMALLIGAIYFLLRNTSNITALDFFLTILFTVLATSANLTLLPSSVMIFFLLALILFHKEIKMQISRKLVLLISLIIIASISTAFFTWYSFKLKEHGCFYYGSGDGFWKVSVESLAHMTAYQYWIIAEIFFGAAFAFILIRSFLFILKKPDYKSLTGMTLIFPALLTGNILASLLMNRIWSINFLEDRAGMFFLPLFFGSICFISDIQTKNKTYKQLLPVFPLFFLPLIFLFHSSFYKSVYGDYQVVTREFVTKVENDLPQNDFTSIISAYQARRQPWAFYNYLKGGKLNSLSSDKFPDLSASYLIGNREEFPVPPENYLQLDYFAPTDLFLYKRMKVAKSKVIYQKDSLKTEGKINPEYFGLLEMKTDTLKGRDLRIDIRFTVESPDIPFGGAFVAEVIDSAHTNLRYEAIDLPLFKPAWNGQKDNCLHSMVIYSVPDGRNKLIIYFWNKNSVPYELKNGTVRVSVLN